MKNKKGFTLVELLAVIVILALIMGIAVVSIGGVLTSSREKTYRETAASLINGVRQQLYVQNKVAEGYYCFTESILEKGGTQSPYGGDYNYGCPSGVESVGGGVSKYGTSATTPSCSATQDAYVHVTENAGVYTYSICLSDGTKYLNEANEQTLLDNSAAIS